MRTADGPRAYASIAACASGGRPVRDAVLRNDRLSGVSCCISSHNAVSRSVAVAFCATEVKYGVERDSGRLPNRNRAPVDLETWNAC